jgi:hypothetical protein
MFNLLNNNNNNKNWVTLSRENVLNEVVAKLFISLEITHV